MLAKLKSVLRITAIAYLPCLLLLSIFFKLGARKYGPWQPISWDQLIHQLPLVALFTLTICFFAGLSTLWERKPEKEKIVCPHCGAPQEEKPEEATWRMRQCIACHETSHRIEWEIFSLEQRSPTGENRG
jgi:hypothetical protein